MHIDPYTTPIMRVRVRVIPAPTFLIRVVLTPQIPEDVAPECMAFGVTPSRAL